MEDMAETLARVEIGISKNETMSSSVATSAFCVRYERNPFFTGRDGLLERLWKELTDRSPKRYNHRISLYGLGGVGKTQIALEYAYRHKSDYNYVYWISGVNQAQLLSGFRDIAKATRCVKENQNGEPQELAKSVLEWLKTIENWLLVIDNLDDITIVNGYLPNINGTGHTLITTRNKNSDGIPAVGLEVEVMKPDDCIQLLLERISPIPMTHQIQSEAQNIANELGFLPLAIEQAAAYIRNSQKIEEFLVVYKKQRREVLGWRPKGNYPYNFTVATTWRMSLEQLQSSCPNSIILIYILSFLNPDEILIEYLQTGSSGLRHEAQAIIENDFYFRESLNALESFSLIRVFGEGQKIGIHRLLQAVIQDGLDSVQKASIASDVIELGLASFPDIADESMRGTCRRYRSQVIASLEHDSTKDDSKWHVLTGRVADYLRMDGYYADGFHWSNLTVDTRMKILGQEHPDTLQSMNGLATLYWRMGRMKEAVELHGKTLDIRERVLGLQHPDTLQSMYGLAASRWSLGHMKEATQLHEKTLEIRKSVLGLEHPDTLKSMYGLAVSYSSLNRPEEAAELHEEALEIQKRILGLEHPDTLWSMNNLAASYSNLGRMKEAARLDEETLEIRKRVFGLEHPDTLQSMNNLAVSYSNLGRTKEAAQLEEKTLEIRRRVLGLEHPDTLWSMNNLAVSYSTLGQLKDAAQLDGETLTIRRRGLGLEHPDTLQSMNNLAMSYSSLGRTEEAVLLHENTLEIRKRVLGLEDPGTLQSMNNLTLAYSNLGRTTEAAQLRKETLNLQNRVLVQ
jgi:tetratricopeptide (TPR) repeat protein